MKIKKKIGNILIEKEIGRGGFGVIYLGIDTSLNRKVAVKVLDSKLTNNEQNLALFKQEAITQGQMDHPNIVSVRHFDKIDSTYFIVFEYVHGRSLESLLESEKHLTLKQALKYMKHILRGLYFAHSRNIIHFDVKPSNILITDSDVAKLTDFGIARLFGTTLNNKSGQRYGTPIYSSPEQILGLSPDLRSDIYSFGIMTFRMLTGILPFSFDIDNSIKKETLLTESAINFPTDIDKKTKNFIDLFILKAIKRDVEMRYQTVLEMLEVLDNIDESI